MPPGSTLDDRAVRGRELDAESAHGCEHSAPPVWRGITPRFGCINCCCGSSRFTTWAYKFVIFEVSGKLARHFWLNPSAPMEAEDWDRLPDRFGLDPAAAAESRELIAALRLAVEAELTDRQRRAFTAIVLAGSRSTPSRRNCARAQCGLQNDVRRAA